jgi:hypothetical protein
MSSSGRPIITGGTSAPRIVGALGTNLGSAQTITFSGAEEVWLLGTLNANLTVTLAGRTAGAHLLILGIQDATGGRALSVSDGTTPALVPIPNGANAAIKVEAECPDSTNVTVIAPASNGHTHAAGSITVTPSGQISSTTVQQAIQELDSEKQAVSEKAQANGYASLDSGGKVPASQITSPGHIVQDEGVDLTQRTKVNFIGAGVAVTDNSGTGTTDVSISGAGVGDASTTVKGVSKVSVAPVSASNPIALGVNDTRVQPQVTGTAAGNLGTTQTIDFTGVAAEQWLIGVLNGNLAITVNNPVAGSRLRIMAVQDGAGGRTLTVAGQIVTVPTTATTGLAMVLVVWVDTTNFRVESAGVFTESDPNAVLKSLGTTKGDTIAFSASATPVRVAVGADNTIHVADSAVGAGVSYKTLLTLLVAALTPTNGNVITGNGTTWTSAAPSGGGGTSSAGTPLAPGVWYLPPIGNATFGGNITGPAGRAYGHPFIAGRSCNMYGINAQLQVLGGTGALYRWAIYADGGGFPSACLTNGATPAIAVDTGSPGDSHTAIYVTPPAVVLGTRYWLLGWACNAAASTAAWKGGSGASGNPMVPTASDNPSVGGTLKADGTGGAVFDATTVSASLPVYSSIGDWFVASEYQAWQMQGA